MTANRAPASGRDGSARRRAAGGSCVGAVHALEHRIDGPRNIADLGLDRSDAAFEGADVLRDRAVRATTLRNAVTAKQTAAAAWPMRIRKRRRRAESGVSSSAEVNP